MVQEVTVLSNDRHLWIGKYVSNSVTIELKIGLRGALVDLAVVGVQIVLEPRSRDLVGGEPSADGRPRLKHRDLQTSLGKVCGGDQAVMSCTDDNSVELCAAHSSLPP